MADLVESSLHFSQQPIEGAVSELVLLQHTTRSQHAAQQAEEHEGGVILSLLAQLIQPLHHTQLLGQLTDTLDDVHRAQAWIKIRS